MTDEDDWRAWSEAVQTALRDRGESLSWLGREVARLEGREKPYSHATVRHWLFDAGVAPAPSKVFLIERALLVKPGLLSQVLGYLPPSARATVDVAEAIHADVKLTDSGRRALLAAYQQLVDHGGDGS